MGCRLWKSKATAYLSAKHPAILKALDWAEKQESPITDTAEAGVYSVLTGYDAEQVSGILFTATQESISDRLRMIRPQLAGPGRGFELWRIPVREFEAP